MPEKVARKTWAIELDKTRRAYIFFCDNTKLASYFSFTKAKK